MLEQSNEQHRRLVKALRKGDRPGAVKIAREHIEGTEHILAGCCRRGRCGRTPSAQARMRSPPGS